MYRSITIQRLLNGFLVTYEHWLQHLPASSVYLSDIDAKPYANLFADLLTYQEAVDKARLKEENKPRKAKVEKEEVREDDDDL